MSESTWPGEFESEEPKRPTPPKGRRPLRRGGGGGGRGVGRSDGALARGRRGPLVPTLVVLGVITVVGSMFAELWTEILWFDSVGFSGVFTTNLWTRIGLFAVGFIVVALLIASSLYLAHRHRPFYVPLTESHESLEQYREALEPLRRPIMVVAPVVIGTLAGMALSGQWQTFLAWRHQAPFGSVDAEFGKDIGFFVFTMPWLQAVIGFLTIGFLAALVVAGFVHYLYGGLQLPGRGDSTRAAIAHVAVLGALLVLVRAAAYWFGRYELATRQGSLMTGITYTDDNAVLPTKVILAVAALICAGLFLAAIFTRSWRLPIIGVALLAITSVVAGTIYPAIIQNVRVNPSEKSLEAPYLQRNIEATRAAYGVDTVDVQPYKATTNVSQGQLRNDAGTIPGIRLVDPIVVAPTFQQLQSLRNYYAFPDALDVDRYTLDGKEADTVVAVREMDLEGVPDAQRNWLNDHTVYTHGFGLVAAYGNRRGTDGQPVFAERNIPPTGDLPEFEPRIYFGERSPEYSVVGAAANATPRELDYPDSSAQGMQNNTYAGTGGVPIGGFLRQAAYAAKYREFNFLLSDAVGDQSRILDHREPLERVARVAPWLSLDGNPYPTVVDGRILWVVDGYTTSAHYPYSHLQSLEAATSDSTTQRAASVAGIRGGQVNYIRNSIKATVDAFDGTVHLYAWDESDPVMQTWRSVYGGTVKPLSAISGELMSHLRYPEDLFKVQRLVLSRYHTTDAASFYGGADFWRVPDDPAQTDQDVFQPPYYLTLAMPGQKTPTFSLTTTFMPVGNREVLSGFLAVDANAGAKAGERAEGYGKLRLLELPRESNVKGPGQVQNDINSSNSNSPGFSLTLSQFLNNNRQQGSRVTLGNLLTLPVGQGLLYVQPIYVSAQSESAYPLSRVTVAAFGERLAWSDTLNGALDGLFGGDSGADAGDSGSGTGDPEESPKPPTDPGETDADVLDKALADMQQALKDGQAALAKGDFAAYGAAQQRVQKALERAIAAAPAGGSATIPSGGGTPSGSATSS